MEIRVSLPLRSTDKQDPLIDCMHGANSTAEMHTFLVTLVRQFDFSLPENGQEIKAVKSGLVTPVVAGEEEKGSQLPLKVTALRAE
jgi:hypothetical protein